MYSYAQVFILLWLYRYVRLIVNCISHWTFKPIPLPNEPTLTCQDVTVIIPTIDGDGEELRETIRSCLQTEPFEIILVTIDANLKRALRMVDIMPTSRIRVLSVAHANKRRQMCHAIPEVKTKITLFADDDVTWPRQILEWILAPFERPEYGGVGTCQRLRREEGPDWSKRIWNFLGAIYLERRNFDISATTHLDGGIPCLSGRTVAYRTHILQDPAFTYGFTHEYWLQRYQLNADDDNFITRWMLSHGWKTMVQYCKEAELRTTLENNPRFLKQCLRWSRSNWRSNLKSMFYEGHVWVQQPWSAYAIHLPTLTASAIIWDPLLIYICYRATENWETKLQSAAIVTLLVWMFVSKFIKLLGHFVRYPEDGILLPISILFGYSHSFIKFYAFLTLNVTTWGSREGADTDDAYRMIRLSQAEREKQSIYYS